jgi:hypothetical protein
VGDAIRFIRGPRDHSRWRERGRCEQLVQAVLIQLRFHPKREGKNKQIIYRSHVFGKSEASMSNFILIK